MASVLTQHNNNARTGVTDQETILTLAAAGTPGRLRKVDEILVDPPASGGPTQWPSQILAQPLFVSDVQGPWADGSATKDLLIVATMHGTVCAFDANNHHNEIWASWLPMYLNVPLGGPVLDIVGADGKPNDDKDMYATNPEWGILSTSVIDRERQRIYVVMWHNAQDGTYRLHALDLITGRSALQNAIIGGGVGGELFSPRLHKQRPGLLLLTPGDLPADRQLDVGPSGTIYIAFGASIVKDRTGTFPAGPDYHGWVFAYDVEPDGFSQRAVWCSSPNAREAGIWQSGGGLTADDQGDIYCMTADGPFHAGSGSYGDSLVKLAPGDLRLRDFFTPYNWLELDDQDLDLGSSAPIFVAGTQYVVCVGKQGTVYCLDRTRLGRYTPGRNDVVDERQATDPLHIGDDHVHGTPVYFRTPALSRLYLWGENDVLRAFDLDRATGQVSPQVSAGGRKAPLGMPGGMLSLSCNPQGEDAILWALLPLGPPAPDDRSGEDQAPTNANTKQEVAGVLCAFDATAEPLLREIWNSEQEPPFDFAKFVPPTIANGRVYVATYDGKLVVYGLT